jgi:hypothetical protein
MALYLAPGTPAFRLLDASGLLPGPIPEKVSALWATTTSENDGASSPAFLYYSYDLNKVRADPSHFFALATHNVLDWSIWAQLAGNRAQLENLVLCPHPDLETWVKLTMFTGNP